MHDDAVTWLLVHSIGFTHVNSMFMTWGPHPELVTYVCACDRYKLLLDQGPSARETKRDSHAFEAARAQWGKATISNKTAVGASGDHRNEVWLG